MTAWTKDPTNLFYPSSYILGREKGNFINLLTILLLAGSIYLYKRYPRSKISVKFAAVAFALMLLLTIVTGDETEKIEFKSSKIKDLI